MTLPLPEKISNQISRENIPNLSLKYYKWANVYKDSVFLELTNDKKEFFQKFIQLSGKGEYSKAYKIREKLLENIGISLNLTTVSRLIIGIGYDHPTEIGFMFDWTSGLPVIPGSSLKGAALNVARSEPSCCTEEEIKKIFGTKDKSGEIIFFPAYPCLKEGQRFLELDVMTPHYPLYYPNPQDNNNPPADWYSPIPLNFLTVPIGVRFCFRLANRGNLMEGNLPLLLKAKDILTYTLTEYGVGAKTNVSYGYFKNG
ncbi:MAG: hypothetical protein DDT22_00605 [candidate division WS2 bacterium]|nr:hypothetical protein [Candidatus Lithacetigena glycinireducens]